MKAAAQLFDRRFAAGLDAKSWMIRIRNWIDSPRIHVYIGTIENRVAQLAMFVDTILTILMVDVELERQIPAFLRVFQQMVYPRCLMIRAQILDTGVSPSRVAMFEAAGWRRHGQAAFRFTCDFLMPPRQGPAIHMRYELPDEGLSLNGRAAGS